MYSPPPLCHYPNTLLLLTTMSVSAGPMARQNVAVAAGPAAALRAGPEPHGLPAAAPPRDHGAVSRVSRA